jgi:hypothetical protein
MKKYRRIVIEATGSTDVLKTVAGPSKLGDVHEIITF